MEDKPLIGKTLTVVEATNVAYNNLQGKIVDETRNTLVIETMAGEEKTILKKGTVFSIEGKIINGDDIQKRLEDRIKQRRSKQWKR